MGWNATPRYVIVLIFCFGSKHLYTWSNKFICAHLLIKKVYIHICLFNSVFTYFDVDIVFKRNTYQFFVLTMFLFYTACHFHPVRYFCLAGQLRFIKGCSSVGCGMKLCLGRGISFGPKTNMAMENHRFLIGYTSSNACFSIVMLVFRGVFARISIHLYQLVWIIW